MSDTSRPAEKPTDQWVTGDEPMTGPQESYLQTLAREAGEEIPANLTKAQASEMIDRLQAVTGRGSDSASGGSGGGSASGGSGGGSASGGSGGGGSASVGSGGGSASGGSASGGSGGGGAGEHLGEVAEREGIVDQQAVLLDQIEDAGMDPSESANPT
jgi:hypothetical protein